MPLGEGDALAEGNRPCDAEATEEGLGVSGEGEAGA